MRSLRSLFAVTAILGATCSVRAAVPPSGPAELRKAASHVVVGWVETIDVESGPAHFDSGWGNRDWHITVRLRADQVEKGEGVSPGDELAIRAFRKGTRRSTMELFAPGGHWPIPARGERVRAYLAARDGAYRLLLPNGFAAAGDFEDEDTFHEQQRALPTAAEMSQLRGLPWLFLFPVEIWMLIALFGLPVAGVLSWLAARRVSSHATRRGIAVGLAVWTLCLLTGFVICLDVFHEWGSGTVALLGGSAVLAGYAALAWALFRSAAAALSRPLAGALALPGLLAGFLLAELLAPREHFLLGNEELDQRLQLVHFVIVPLTGALTGWLLACLLGTLLPYRAAVKQEPYKTPQQEAVP